MAAPIFTKLPISTVAHAHVHGHHLAFRLTFMPSSR
jgi:hypothetical protein